MKNLIKIMLPIFAFSLLFSCASSSGSPLSQEKMASLLQSGEFTFMAQRANPMSSDVVNILNSMPNSASNRVLNLDYGYSLQIEKEKLDVNLPYFGRMYIPNYDTTKNSYRFASKDFQVAKSNGKKDSHVFSFSINDQKNIRKMYLEVFKNGKAYLSIDSNDRQPISYDGYIMENATVKK